MCAERFSRPTETKRLNDRAPCSCAGNALRCFVFYFLAVVATEKEAEPYARRLPYMRKGKMR